MKNLSTSLPHQPIRRLIACFALLAGLAMPLAAQTGTGVGIGDRVTKSGSLAEQYADFNARLMQIQTVKSLPFFNKTPTERYSAVRGYVQSARTGDVKGVASSVKADFSNGGIARDVSIALMTNVLTQVSQGKSIDESVSGTIRYMMTPEYLIGNLMGGTLGAALGAMIPIPLVGGFVGQMLGGVPAMTGAMLGSNVGSKIVHGIRNGNLDMGEIVKSIDWTSLMFQSVGATAGMLVGGALPVPFLGQLVGGVIGGSAGLAAAKWVKKKLNIGQADQDWINMPEYADSQPIDWRDIPVWARDTGIGAAGVGAGVGASIVGAVGTGVGAVRGTVGTITTGITGAGAGTGTGTASFAPAAPVTTLAALEERAQDALRRYSDAERAGQRGIAATAYSEYGSLKARLDALRTTAQSPQ